MSGLEIVSSVLGFTETAISLFGRLRKAYERQTELAEVLAGHEAELAKVNAAIKLVRDEEALQTAAVTSELVEMAKVAQSLVKLLGHLSKSRSAPGQLLHQLVSGSRDEEKLRDIMQQMGRSQDHLALRVQVAHVGLTKTMSDSLAVETETVKRIDELLQGVFGDGKGLKIAEFLRSRDLQGSGAIPLTDADVSSLPKEENTDAVLNEGTRLVIGNLTLDQAIQINGPIGRDGWVEVSRVEIRDNKASGNSTMINHAISEGVFDALMKQRAQALQR